MLPFEYRMIEMPDGTVILECNLICFCVFREGLMTYKQFIQVLDDDVSPAEAEGR
jgi:hypothetical protein